MDAPDLVAVLDDSTRRFADLLDVATADGRLGASVRACPGWDLAELAAHVGEVHQWAAHAVRAGNPRAETEDPPADRGAVAAWYRRHAAALVDLLSVTPPDAPVWTFGDEPHRAAWWQRRQAHEVSIHTWDAQSALGTPDRIDPAFAWDGVDEVATMFYPRQVRLGRTAPLAGALRLVAEDLPASEIVIGHGDPVTVSSSAENLLLLVWHRLDPTDLEIGEAAAELLAGAITP